ncbi:MAG: hypothetical protein ABJD53_14565 [Gammaproteobacteria bacterium]
MSANSINLLTQGKIMILFSPANPQDSGTRCSPARAGRTASTLAFVAIALPFAAHADNCDALYNAGIKSLQTPHHVYSTKSVAGAVKTPTGESIFAGGIEYILISGSWKRSPMTPQDMIEAAQEKLKTHPDVCTAAGTETIAGQAVITYKVHNNESDTESLVRILKSSGLLLGQSVTLPGDSHMEIRYEYTNVHPPVGVN